MLYKEISLNHVAISLIAALVLIFPVLSCPLKAQENPYFVTYDHNLAAPGNLEVEDINGADKTLKEVVGHDGESDFADANGEARREHKREIELKLILSSNTK